MALPQCIVLSIRMRSTTQKENCPVVRQKRKPFNPYTSNCLTRHVSTHASRMTLAFSTNQNPLCRIESREARAKWDTLSRIVINPFKKCQAASRPSNLPGIRRRRYCTSTSSSLWVSVLVLLLEYVYDYVGV